MFNKIKNFFKLYKKETPLSEDALEDLLQGLQDGKAVVDYNDYPSPEIIENNKDKTIFFLDDISNMWYLYNSDIITIKKKHDVDLLKEFNIIKCFGEKAGFSAYKFTETEYRKVDYAILDITLGYGIKLRSGEYIEYDGIDIFLRLRELNPDIKFIFCTAHTLNKKNPTVGYFFDKFESNTGLKFKDYYLNKSSDRAAVIYNLLYNPKE